MKGVGSCAHGSLHPGHSPSGLFHRSLSAALRGGRANDGGNSAYSVPTAGPVNYGYAGPSSVTLEMLAAAEVQAAVDQLKVARVAQAKSQSERDRSARRRPPFSAAAGSGLLSPANTLSTATTLASVRAISTQARPAEATNDEHIAFPSPTPRKESKENHHHGTLTAHRFHADPPRVVEATKSVPAQGPPREDRPQGVVREGALPLRQDSSDLKRRRLLEFIRLGAKRAGPVVCVPEGSKEYPEALPIKCKPGSRAQGLRMVQEGIEQIRSCILESSQTSLLEQEACRLDEVVMAKLNMTHCVQIASFFAISIFRLRPVIDKPSADTELVEGCRNAIRRAGQGISAVLQYISSKRDLPVGKNRALRDGDMRNVLLANYATLGEVALRNVGQATRYLEELDKLLGSVFSAQAFKSNETMHEVVNVLALFLKSQLEHAQKSENSTDVAQGTLDWLYRQINFVRRIESDQQQDYQLKSVVLDLLRQVSTNRSFAGQLARSFDMAPAHDQLLLSMFVTLLSWAQMGQQVIDVIEAGKKVGVRSIAAEIRFLSRDVQTYKSTAADGRAYIGFIDDLVDAVKSSEEFSNRSDLLAKLASAYARAGEVDKAKSLLPDDHEASIQSVAEMELSSLAARQDLQGLLSAIECHYRVSIIAPQPAEDQRTTSDFPVPVRHLKAAVEVACQGKDLKTARQVLDNMTALAMKPSAKLLSRVIDAHLKAQEFSLAVGYIEQLIEAGHQPNKSTLTTTISTLIRDGLPSRARQLLQTLQKRGQLADVVAYTTLMKAEIEAERPENALEIFDSVMGDGQMSFEADVPLFNTALQALSRTHASTTSILEFVENMREKGYAPSDHTYTILIEALGSRGAMADAENAFARMVVDGVQPSAHHFVAMLKWYLRLGSLSDAEYFYSEMQAAGLFPNSHLNSLLSYHAKRYSLTDLQSEEGQLAADLRLLHVSIASGVDAEISVYRRTHGIDADDESSQVASFDPIDFVVLLDQYRRAGKIRELLAIWSRAFSKAVRRLRDQELAFERLSRDPPSDSKTGAQLRNELAPALSIVIDALSEAGMHGQVAQIWGEVRQAGFGFDAHNWNHLAVALVRAGRAEDAFKIVENVLTDKLDLTQEQDVAEHLSAAFDAVPSPVKRPAAPTRTSDTSRSGDGVPQEMRTTLSRTTRDMDAWAPHTRTIAAIAPLVERLRHGQTLPRTQRTSADHAQEQIDYDYMQSLYSKTVRLVDDHWERQSSIEAQRARSERMMEGSFG